MTADGAIAAVGRLRSCTQPGAAQHTQAPPESVRNSLRINTAQVTDGVAYLHNPAGTSSQPAFHHRVSLAPRVVDHPLGYLIFWNLHPSAPTWHATADPHPDLVTPHPIMLLQIRPSPLLLTIGLLILLVQVSNTRHLKQGDSSGQSNLQINYYEGRNLNTDLLILDTNSLQFKGNHPYFYGMSGPDTITKESCAQRCARTTGCNAFVVCEKQEGCGSGCKNYVAANPNGGQPPYDGMNYEGSSLPIRYFGVWTYPSYFLDGCANTTADYSGVTGDKWPWGLCSLKSVSDVSNPPFYDDASSGEFTSGVLVKPANCPDGLPYSVCAQCNALGGDQVQECLDCASGFKENNPVREASTIYDKNYTFCATCMTGGRDKAACLQCVKDKAPTGEAFTCVR